MTVPQSIFKAYDIRGIVDQDLTLETVKLIGLAIGTESIAKGERGLVLVEMVVLVGQCSWMAKKWP